MIGRRARLAAKITAKGQCGQSKLDGTEDGLGHHEKFGPELVRGLKYSEGHKAETTDHVVNETS